METSFKNQNLRQNKDTRHEFAGGQTIVKISEIVVTAAVRNAIIARHDATA